ncbi:MAG: MFS transporter, partial [Verrucomicrobia bacterium]|nr:MFS transporter [Verrucomicrobiota bacterium]
CVSYFEVSFFYLAYVLYGLSQAGSHLLWNLSGPMFAKEADSAQYTRVNILMVGLRGSITPAIGGVLCHCCGPAFVILLSAGICLAGVLYMTITQTVIGRRQKQLLDH